MSLDIFLGVMAAVGVYLIVTSLPLAAPRPSVDERLRWFDFDSRVAERRMPRWTVRPLLPWAPVDALVRPLLEDLAGPLRQLIDGNGVFGAELEEQLRLVRPGTDPRWFVAQQLLVGGLAAASVLAFCVGVGELGTFGLTMSLIGAVAGFVAPRFQLVARVRARRRRVLAELPAICRLLSLALEAGMSLDRAIVAVASRGAGPLGRALLAAQQEVVVGDRRLKDALADVARRERLADLDTLVTLLCVADQQGLELIPSLEAMATSLNEKRAAHTIAAAEKGSIKMLAPVAFVMFPVALAVALAPLLVTIFGVLGNL